MKIAQLSLFGLAALTMSFYSCDSDSYSYMAVGTYTQKESHVDGKAEGIYIVQLNNKTGELSMKDTIQGPINPSYLYIHPETKCIYTVHERALAGNEAIGTIAGYKAEQESGEFKLINKVLAGGDAPCHIIKTDDSEHIIVSSYMGTVSLFEIKDDLSLSTALDIHTPDTITQDHPRQDAPHPHMATSGPDGSILIADLGNNVIYHMTIKSDQLQLKGSTPMSTGTGPRHMVVDGDLIYVLGELSTTIEVYQWQGIAKPMKAIQSINTLSTTEDLVNSAAIHLHPSGKWLYCSNRGLQKSAIQSISLMKIDKDGLLELVETVDTGGLIPRDFAITPDGDHLIVANQNSDNMLSYYIDPESGRLTPTGHELQIPTPACIKFF